MTEEERAAVDAARALIPERGQSARHRLAAAVLTHHGRRGGLDLECRLPRPTICAEATALGNAEPAAEVTFRAAGLEGAVLPPCRDCHEPSADFALRARTAVPGSAAGVRAAERGLS